MSNAHNILNREEDRRIVEAIKQAELNTSGEIKVHIENHCKGDVEERSLFTRNRRPAQHGRNRTGSHHPPDLRPRPTLKELAGKDVSEFLKRNTEKL